MRSEITVYSLTHHYITTQRISIHQIGTLYINEIRKEELYIMNMKLSNVKFTYV